MSLTLIDKSMACRLEAMTVNFDGSVLARFTVGIVSGGDATAVYKPIADKNYLLSASEAAPVLDSKTAKDGKVFEQLTAALVATLSQRDDWIA